MTFKKSLAVGAFTLLFAVGLPNMAAADDSNTTDTTLNALQTQLQGLLSQVSSLEAQIRTLGGTASSTVMWQHPGGPGMVGGCEMFTHALVQGDSDSNTDGEVSQLQTILKADPTVFPQGLVTGFFGPLTAAAVANFQIKQGIVTASSSAEGIVGPNTRGALFNSCGHMFGGNGQGNGNGNGTMNGGVVAGTISAVNGSTSITVTSFLAGATKTVDLNPSTQIYVWSGSMNPSNTSGTPTPTAAVMAPGVHAVSFTQGSVADLVFGKGIVVMGTPNSDGSITATRINVGIPLPPMHPPTPESDNSGSDS